MPHICGKTTTGRLRRASTEIRPIARPHEEIARIAYGFWEERNGYGGSADDDWYRAEREWDGEKGADKYPARCHTEAGSHVLHEPVPADT